MPSDNKGGRPPLPERCPCGANSLHRAALRAYDCCKKAGLMPRTVYRGGRKPGSKNKPKQ